MNKLSESKLKPGTIGVVLVNYNGNKLTEECIDSILNQEKEKVSIFLIDNGSTQENQQELRARWADTPRVKMSFLAVNDGYTKANNNGLKKALDQGMEYVLMLNNDTQLQQNSIHKFRAVFENNLLKTDLSLLSCVISDGTGQRVWSNGMNDLPFFNFPKSRDKNKLVSKMKFKGGLLPAEHLSSCAIFCHRDYLRIHGLMDEKYKIYFDDTEWSAKGQCWVFQEVMIRHKISGTAGRIGRDSFSFFKAYWYGRNLIRYYFWRKKISLAEKAIFLSVTVWVVLALYVRDAKSFTFYWLGVRDGLWQMK